MSVEVRQNGDGDHELGAEIDGAWVAFVTKSGGYVDSLVTRAKENAEKNPQPAGAAGDGGDGNDDDDDDNGTQGGGTRSKRSGRSSS